jgi:hypothetical protein
MRTLPSLIVIALLLSCSSKDETAARTSGEIPDKVTGDKPPASSDAHTTPKPGDAAPPAANAAPCKPLPFAKSIDLAEASGAAILHGEVGQPILVVSDSGNKGAYVIVDPRTGDELESGSLPLDKVASDDLEGVSYRGKTLYGLTSSGWMRQWRRDGAGFELAAPAYPIAEKNSALLCANPRRTNCAQNFEGLCLVDGELDAPCVGFAASLKTGKLWCLKESSGRIQIDPSIAIDVSHRASLAGCHFDAQDESRLWIGKNMLGGAQIGTVENWRSPREARVQLQGMVGPGFPEAIAVSNRTVYRFSDTAARPSLAARYHCADAQP